MYRPFVALLVPASLCIAQTEFTISVKVDEEGEVTATIDDSVIPDVRVSQHLVVVESGQLGGGAQPLDLMAAAEDGEAKYFPAVIRDAPTDDEPEGLRHEFNGIAELGEYLDERFADDERTPSSWEWGGLAYSRTLAATKTSTPAQLRVELTTRAAKWKLKNDILDLIDRDGKPVVLTTQTTIEWPDGTVTTGVGEAALYLTQKYHTPAFQAEVIDGHPRYVFPAGMTWSYGKNHWIDGGSRPIWLRMVVGEWLAIAPEKVQVKVR